MPTMDFTLALALVPFISAGAGAYFGSYLRKKGENVATHEDIGLLVDQVRAVTETAKGIEAKISDEVWNRQRQWELKRDAVYSVIQAIGLTDDAVVELVNGLTVQKRSDHPERFDTVVTDRWLKSYESVEDLERKRAMALIVCGVKLTDVVLALKKDLRKILGELGEGKLDAYQERDEALQKNMAKAFACARDELNISDPKHQSGGSSAASKG